MSLSELQSHRKEINLSVLQRVFPQDTGNPDMQVVDYSLVVPAVSIYRAAGQRWTRLQIFGPLFVLTVAEKSYPYLLLLNGTCFKNVKDFWFEFPGDRAKTFLKKPNQLYIQLPGGETLMIATESEQDAVRLNQELHRHREVTAASPAKRSGERGSVPVGAQPNLPSSLDPTIGHAMRIMFRF